jgi:UDP-glucose 4-epimerase
MHCLVTGCAGFIGSHLVDHLLAGGHHVTGVDCFTDYYDRRQKENNLARARCEAGFHLIEADLLQADLEMLLGDVDLVFHLAGQPGVRGSWGPQFGRYVDNNVLATQRLLEAALATGRVPVVYASSSSVYGNLPEMPLREDMAPAPVSPYGVSKLAAEHLCRLYSTVHGVPTIALRLFTVFGPRQRPDMAFQRFLSRARDGEEIVVYGDGSQTRDFTFVGDVVRAFDLAGGRCRAGELSGQVFNVAGGARVALRAVIDLLPTVTGRDVPLRFLPAQPGDMRDTWADTAQIEQRLGFTPAVALLEGLRAQWQAVVAAGAS